MLSETTILIEVTRETTTRHLTICGHIANTFSGLAYQIQCTSCWFCDHTRDSAQNTLRQTTNTFTPSSLDRIHHQAGYTMKQALLYSVPNNTNNNNSTPNHNQQV
jgi:hypothetical protein